MERKRDLFARVAFLDDEGLKIACERWFMGIEVAELPKTGASGAWETAREIHL